jgi:hypothetical protein
MTSPRTGPDREHKLLIKPHADRVRAILNALPCPGIAELQFTPGEWIPSARFYMYEGAKQGRVYSRRNHGGKTYIFRLA